MAEGNNQTSSPVTFDGNILIYESKKYVPEGDLISVKKGLEKQLEDVKSASAESLKVSQLNADGHYQKLLVEKAAKEQLDSKVKELEPVVEKAKDLESKLQTATESRVQLDTKLLTLRKDLLTTRYKVEPAKLESKTMAELDSLEEALKLVGPKSGKSYDTTSGGGGSPQAATPFAAELEELKQAKERAGIKVD